MYDLRSFRFRVLKFDVASACRREKVFLSNECGRATEEVMLEYERPYSNEREAYVYSI